MIEIIRDENETGTKENGLPKEIRQIGNADVGDRIYLEEKVYQYLHRQTGWGETVFGEGRKVFVLLGKIENYAGQKCVFVESAIEIEEITYLDGVPVWNDKTWGYVFQRMKKFSEEMIVVGWAMDIKDSAPSLTDRLIGVHITHFGGKHQVLFLLDSMEKEENFYCSRQGRLRRREGFYLYHDKKSLAAIEDEMPRADVTIEHATVETDLERIFWEEENAVPEKEVAADTQTAKNKENAGKFRAQTLEAEENKEGFHFSPTYLLAAIALVLIVAAYQNNSQMRKMSETIAQMNVAQTMFGGTEEVTEETTQEKIEVEKINSSLESRVSDTQTATEAAQTEDTAETAAQDVQQTAETAAQNAQDTAETATQEAQQDETVQAAAETDGTAAAEASTGDETAQTAAVSGTQTYLEQGYYIVQQGDNLEGICLKVYQTTAMMDKICEANGIENSDEIYEGQYLTLPK